MADSVEVATVLPRELRLGVPAKMPQARSYIFRQQSTLPKYTYGETVTINIPRLQRSYLRKDSYLRFRLNGHFTPNYVNQGLALDTSGAFGLFEKLEVFDYLGSTVLESISGLPQLSALLLDLGLKEIIDGKNGTELCGLAGDYVWNGSSPITTPGTAGNTASVANIASALTQGGVVYPPDSGMVLLENIYAGTANSTANTAVENFTREFAIPLPSFLGFLSQKMVPLHNGFTIVLTVASQNKPMFLTQPTDAGVEIAAAGGALPTPNTIVRLPLSVSTSNSPSWNVSDVYMECQILELGPVAESMILSSTQGAPLVVHSKAFRNYVSTVKGATWSGNTLQSSGTQEFVLNLNLNVASLTNILWIMRQTNQTDSILYPSCGARTRNMLQRWQFQYGSTTLPQNNGIQTMAQTAPAYPTGADTATNESTYLGYSIGSSESYQELLKTRPCYIPALRLNYKNYNVDACYNLNLDNRAANPITSVNWKGVMPSARSFTGLPRFAAGLNLQLVNGKDGDMISGLNTNGMNTSIRGIFHPLYTDYMTSVTVDAFAEYDSFINISPGIATTVSF